MENLAAQNLGSVKIIQSWSNGPMAHLNRNKDNMFSNQWLIIVYIAMNKE